MFRPYVPKPRISRAALGEILSKIVGEIVINDNGRGFCFLTDRKRTAIFYKSLSDIEKEVLDGGYDTNGIYRRPDGMFQLCIPYKR